MTEKTKDKLSKEIAELSSKIQIANVGLDKETIETSTLVIDILGNLMILLKASKENDKEFDEPAFNDSLTHCKNFLKELESIKSKK